MRRSEKRSKKREKRPQIVRKSEENGVDLIPFEYPEPVYRPGMVNQLWDWNTLEDVVFK